jgi:protocatechuate 3,4-dioxygenase beta subunit
MRSTFRIAATLALMMASLLAVAAERIVGLPCEGCDAVFVGKPEAAAIATIARIAPPDEAGEALQWRGRTLDTNGKPVAGVIVYAYHTDASGVYPQESALRGTSARQHGRLRGWVRSDAEGRFGFDTIRPAAYPGRAIPAHIHVHVIEPGRCTYYLDDVNFRDDPLLTEATTSRERRGGDGVVDAKRGADGTWQITRDIVLGLDVAKTDGRDQVASRR